MMNAGAVQNQPAMVRIVELVKKVFFGMAYRGSAELPAMQRVAVLILILETAQMLAFPLHLDDAMPWDSEDAVRPLAQVLTYVSTVRMDATQSTAIFRALMGVALAWVYVFLGVAATVGFGCVPAARACRPAHPRAHAPSPPRALACVCACARRAARGRAARAITRSARVMGTAARR